MGPVLPVKILVVCTHNAVRSQMAEAFFRSHAADRFTTHSAGTDPTQVDPRTIQVMNEVGIDLADYTAKSIKEFVGQHIHYVITVCEQARQSCPNFPGALEKLHWDLPDPQTASGTPEEQLDFFRSIRYTIRKNVNAFLATH